MRLGSQGKGTAGETLEGQTSLFGFPRFPRSLPPYHTYPYTKSKPNHERCVMRRKRLESEFCQE